MSTAIANPVSPTLSSNSVVSDLENALMQSIGKGMQSGESTDSGSLKQEMQLLTELLNQSDSTQNNPTATATPSTSGTPSASGTPTTDSDPTTSGTPSTSGGDPTKTSTGDPTKSDPSSKADARLHRAEARLDKALEQTITDSLQDGQSPVNGNALQQEMNLLIQLLGQSA